MPSDYREQSSLKLFTAFLSVVVLVIILKELRNIFIPLCLSLLLYFLFNGVVKRLSGYKIPRWITLIFLMLFIFILFYFLGVLLFASASSFIDNFPLYSQKLQTALTNLLQQLNIPMGNLDVYFKNIDWIKNINTSQITAILSGTFDSFASFMGNLMLVLLFLMFMLAGRQSMSEKLYSAFADQGERATKLQNMVNSIEDEVQHYLLIKSFICLITSVTCGIILVIAGFEFVILSTLLMFVLHFIPNFGSIIATIFPILVGVLQYGFSLRVLIVLIILMITQFVIGNILEPRFTGKSLNLSSIVILISLIFWGYVWGVVGMMLAVPLTSAIKIFCENIPSLKPLAIMISAD